MSSKPRKSDRYKSFYFTLFADDDQAAIIREVMRRVGTKSPQLAVMTVFKEFHARTRRYASGQEEASQELTYERLYHDLAAESLETRRQLKKLLRALDQAKESVEGLKQKRRER